MGMMMGRRRIRKGREVCQGMSLKKKKNDDPDEEEIGCCSFFCFACNKAHRTCAIFKHYNLYLSRPARALILITSLFAFILITGFLIQTSTQVNNPIYDL